jgi:hypothetical protein
MRSAAPRRCPQAEARVRDNSEAGSASLDEPAAPATPVAPQTPDVAWEAAPDKTRATGAKEAPQPATTPVRRQTSERRFALTVQLGCLVEEALRSQKWVLSWYSKTPRRKLTPNAERRTAFRARVRACAVAFSRKLARVTRQDPIVAGALCRVDRESR